MRSYAVAALAALLVGSAIAQPPAGAPKTAQADDPWVFLRFSDGAMAWNLGAGRWLDNNDRVEGQRLVYYARPIETDGEKIAWAQETWVIRCAANTYQVKAGEELTEDLTLAFTLSASESMPILENSPESVLKRVYCDNIEFSDAQHATGLFEVMDAMSAE